MEAVRASGDAASVVSRMCEICSRAPGRVGDAAPPHGSLLNSFHSTPRVFNTHLFGKSGLRLVITIAVKLLIYCGL